MLELGVLVVNEGASRHGGLIEREADSRMSWRESIGSRLTAARIMERQQVEVLVVFRLWSIQPTKCVTKIPVSKHFRNQSPSLRISCVIVYCRSNTTF